MKKINTVALVLIASLALASCSSEDASLPTEPNSKLLKTFKVNRDVTGAYSVDFNVSDHTKVDKVSNSNDYTRQYFLYPATNNTANKISQNLSSDDSKLKIGFVDTQNDNSPSITIIDDVQFAKKTTNVFKLDSYSIVSNEDGTYGLDFSVKNNTTVSFHYNDEIGTYEIHLENGEGEKESFSRTMIKEDGEALKIDFVNHFTNSNAKNRISRSERKPVIVIDDGEDA
jgi:hypothetical protein